MPVVYKDATGISVFCANLSTNTKATYCYLDKYVYNPK